MEGALPRFHTPYVEPEQIIRALPVSDGEHFPFCTEAAILLVRGTSIAETEMLLQGQGLEPVEVQDIVRRVNGVKKWKVRLNGIATIMIGLFYTTLGAGLLVAFAFLVGCLLAFGLLIPGGWFLIVGVYKVGVGMHRVLVG
jgi:hypothetical protein